MMRKTLFGLLPALVVAMIGFVGETRAQKADSEEELSWSNSTDLSIVVAHGNANTQNFGLQNVLIRHWERSNLQLKVDVLQTNEADDRFLLVEPGLTWLPGEVPPPGATTVIEPSLETEAARFFVESKYDHKFGKRRYWSGGASWDRNEDAGILNRYIVFGGLGHIWWDRKDLEFSTAWALSYTDREEEEFDPEKDQRFGGFRFFSDYRVKWGKVVEYKNDFTANVSFKDISDYSLDMTNAISVRVGSRLAFKVSLQGLFESEPALEDVDVIARVQLVDPDGIPASGDEFFETLGSGGFDLLTGTGDIRKEGLDLIFRTSLVINF